MNRIQAAIVRQEANIKSRLEDGRVDQERLDKLHKTLDMDVSEFVRYQELKSLAFASNKLSLDEAQLMYNLLGNTPTHFNSQPIHVKVVLTQAFQELLTWRMAG